MSGNILRIHSICSKQDNINLCMKHFYARLLVRGYQLNLLIPAFIRGIIRARTFIKRGSVRRCKTGKEEENKGRVFFHLTYHPRDPTSKDLQRQWRQHLPPLWRLKNKYKIPMVGPVN